MARLNGNHEKIMGCNEQLIADPVLNLPFYGEFSQYIVYKEDKSMPTAGVNMSSVMNFYYNPEFFNGMTQQEANFVCLHEFFHLLYSHNSRGKKCLSHNLANIAQDMIINSILKKDILSVQKRDFLAIPTKTNEKTGNKESFCYFIPDNYKGEWIFEELYEWLKQQNEDAKSQGKPEPYPDGYSFDVHMADEVPEEVREQIVKDIIEGLRNRGLVSGSVEETLGKLRKKNVNLTPYIKRAISQVEGVMEVESYSRPNRRGLPTYGYLKRGSALNVLLDTSGSMHGYFDTVVSYIFRDDIAVNLIQCDTEVKVVEKFNSKNKLKTMKIRGLGGTTLQPALDLVKEKYSKLNTIILTDGYTDSLNTDGLGKVLVISCGQQVPTSSTNVKQIIIKK